MNFKAIGLAGGLAAATAAGFTAAVPARERTGMDMLPSAETVMVSPNSFEHPQPGEFLLANGRPAAAPRSRVEIRDALEIMRFQVSVGEYARCVAAGACELRMGAVRRTSR